MNYYNILLFFSSEQQFLFKSFLKMMTNENIKVKVIIELFELIKVVFELVC